MQELVKMSYIEAERKVLEEELREDKNFIIMGEGVNDPGGEFGVTNDLYKEFGEQRIIDTPLAETGMAGVAIGAALAGSKVIYMHNRCDFLLLSFDQIINHAAKLRYMSGGQVSIPVIFWAVTGQGWGTAAQHSQNIHGMLMTVPGIKIIMPSSVYDARGLLKTALHDGNPILFLEHRDVMRKEEEIPDEQYTIPIGKGEVKRPGQDVTIIAISNMVTESLKAAEKLQSDSIDCEVIDLRTIKPYDEELILKSVQKTGRVVIADTGWYTGGVAKEIADCIYHNCLKSLQSPIEIVALPDVPTPASYKLEEVYYKTSVDIELAVRKVLNDAQE